MAKGQSPITQYLYQGKKLSKQKQSYNREVKNLYRRMKSWVKQYGFKIELESVLKSPPKRDITKHAAKLHDIRKLNLTDIDTKQKEYVEGGYVTSFEQAMKYGYRGAPLAMLAMMYPELVTPEIYAKYPEIQGVLRPEPREKQFKPRTEQQYYDNEPEEDEDDGYDFSSSKPISEEAEIESQLNAILYEMLDYESHVDQDSPYTSTNKYRMDLAEKNANRIQVLWDNVVNGIGERALWNRLKDPGIASQITSIAHALYNIPSDDKAGSISAGYLDAIATILNAGPLTQEQAESLSMYGTMDFDLYDNEY